MKWLAKVLWPSQISWISCVYKVIGWQISHFCWYYINRNCSVACSVISQLLAFVSIGCSRTLVLWLVRYLYLSCSSSFNTDSLGCQHPTQGRSSINTKNLQLTEFSIQGYLISPNRISSYIRRFCSTRWIEYKPVAKRAITVWKNFVKVISHWKGLFKSSRPPAKSYETLVDHYRDPWIALRFIFFLQWWNTYAISHYLSDG